MIFEQLRIGTMANFTYVIGDPASGEAAIVDPHGEIDRILARVAAHHLRVRYILNTHTHWDHIGGNGELRQRTGASVVTHEAGQVPRDLAVQDGEVLPLGELSIRVLHTPGHSPESVCYEVEGKLLTGDTLFVRDCGRADLPGSDPAQLYHSLVEVIGGLGDEVEVFPGHDYGESPSSTIEREKAQNPCYRPRSEGEFVRFMAAP